MTLVIQKSQKIDTITVTCAISSPTSPPDAKIDIDYLYHNFLLDPTDFQKITYQNHIRAACLHTIISEKKFRNITYRENGIFELVPKATAKHKKHKYFRNECNVTFNKRICIKVFANFTIHMTGIKSIDDIQLISEKLLDRIKLSTLANGKSCFG